ncbi:DUF3662 domain-containing protein [Schaalia sp. 19OD2882]|uniref:FhaA domain-containing protein n=1 Tax=Schaalia sp. 19OD2882 TaxID=2794089 RepID=UPI001C1EAFE3|nr:DUF3662 and FHA domain-containing protein [Schaalia sp. 19OD2882]QWW19618.1 DUF3662 domain-containing protein [Schaalia sp. 19OD2882]
MSIFDRFENAVERGLNGAFSHVFRSEIKPVDITSAIRRSMDKGVRELSSHRSVAPNSFTVKLSTADIQSLGPDLDMLAGELADDAARHAADSGWTQLGPTTVAFESSDQVDRGHLRVEARARRGAVAPAANVAPSPEHPVIDVGGQKWLLTDTVTVLGRGSEADVVVDDSGVSRRHLELRITPSGVIATDLGSTNGTFVEGHKVEAATLLDGNQIVIGRTRILFWTHPSDSEAI